MIRYATEVKILVDTEGIGMDTDGILEGHPGYLDQIRGLKIILKVSGPFVQTLCIEKDSYMDAI